MIYTDSSPRPATRPQYTFRRERSLEDLNKDIATIWRELQEIDKITQPGAPEDRCGFVSCIHLFQIKTYISPCTQCLGCL